MKAFQTIMTLALLSLSQLALATEGVLIVSKSTNLSSQQITTSKIYLTDSKLQISNSGQDNSSMIFDANKEVFTFIDNKKREYYQFDKPTLVQLKEQLKMMVQVMKQFASQMPEEQQKKLDMILNPSNGAIINYKETGTGKVGNWNTKQFQGTNENEKVLELNIASFETLGIEAEKFNAMKQLIDFFTENLQEVATMLPTSQSMSAISFDENSPILKEGFPVKTRTYAEGSSKSETIIQSITETGIAESQFSIPSGYARKTINMQQQFQK
ncbi:hypothetical protein [Reichenbachiella sp. MSK19-1]|uniref:hypothetical protein n=1 Tax=Reichenbachiella sp. MSK19-1 TaxID=1897631 RepID=UPI000E6BE058|nr:hypothetical protein [Reichenbachiella sp. MSK19-1]RJE70504.1 hypothetical protein BGP76_10475 [Reichenbachiella sp. MSK19-1]